MNTITKKLVGLFLVLSMMFTQMSFVMAVNNIEVDALRYEICDQCYIGHVTYKIGNKELDSVTQAGPCYCIPKSPYRHETWTYSVRTTLSCDNCSYKDSYITTSTKTHCTGGYL